MFTWIDTETTGLDYGKDALLEIAVVVTDDDLQTIAEKNIVIKPKRRALRRMDDFVTKMHTKSGLLAELSEGVSVRQAEIQILGFLDGCGVPKGSPMGGNSVHFDRRFIERDMPTLAKRFGHRNIDVSTLGELAKRWHEKAYSEWRKSASETAHRALDDIRSCIEQLRFYRKLGL
jgi:oligoribonuclease